MSFYLFLDNKSLYINHIRYIKLSVVSNFQSMQDSKLSEDFMAFNTHPISDENREYCIMSEKDIA